MPNTAEKRQIKVNTGWSDVRINTVIGTHQVLTDQQCRELLETVATTTGEPNSWPNIFWALEREMDARVGMLLGGELTDPKERKRISSELKGVAIAYSIQTGISVEDATMSAMRRWQDGQSS